MLDGPPTIIMVIEAPERLKAGDYLVDILDSVEGMTENLSFYLECNLQGEHQCDSARGYLRFSVVTLGRFS